MIRGSGFIARPHDSNVFDAVVAVVVTDVLPRITGGLTLVAFTGLEMIGVEADLSNKLT